MRIFRLLNLKFPNPAMEKEFSSIRCQGILRDYKVTLQFLFFMNLLAGIQPIIQGDLMDFLIATVTICILIILFLIRNCCKAHIQYLTLFALFAYNFSRLAFIHRNYLDITATSLFFHGYAFSAIQSIVIRRIHEVRYQLCGIIISLTIRSSVLMSTSETSPFDAISVTRQIFIDLFLIYMFYSSEKTERKVFQNFYENREELMKFKELLADSLPQSITVLDCVTQQPLFSNNAFLTTLEHKVEPEQFDEEPTIPMSDRPLTAKPKLRSLYVDPATLNEVGAMQNVQNPLYGSTGAAVCLKDMIEKLLSENMLVEKAISLSATYLGQNQKRLFEVILKRVKWDTLDAVAVLLNDITNQEKLISLKVANNNKDRIIATVSHELRTPIHGILGLLETIEKKVTDPEVLEELSWCKNNASLLLCHFNSILDFHQISTGNLRLNPTKVSLHKVLRDVVRLFKFQCKTKNIFLDLIVSKELSAYIITDELRLKEILVNLLSNALKFTFKGGIKLEAKPDTKDPNYVYISVTDTGIGIKEEDKPRLFNLLGQEDLEGRVNKNGAGFGLSISNALVGKLSNKENEIVIALSETVGGGSQFAFKILKNLNVSKYSVKVKATQEKDISNSDPVQQYSKDRMLEKDDEGCLGETVEESIDSHCYEEYEKHMDIPSRIASYASLNRRSTQEFKYLSRSLKSPLPIGTLGTLAEGIMGNEAVNDKNGNSATLIFTPRKKQYIVVVDDSPFNLLIAQNLIKDLGYLVKTAIGGQEAIDIIKALIVKGETIKIILMDCQMPVMDGYETTKNLKDMMNRKEIPEVPIIAWTANNSEEDVESCYKAGMVGHLPKPASQENLYKAISKFA